jgi:cytochrome c553
MKTCIACHERKEIKHFYPMKNGTSASRCKECYREQVLKRYHHVTRRNRIEEQRKEGVRLYGRPA